MNLEITNKHLEKLQNNKFFKHNIYRILSNEIKTVKDYCDVEDDLGCIHNLMFSSLFDEHKLKINSALDKKDFLIKTLMSKNYYSGYEVIGEFIRGDVPIEINTKYGICKIKPNQLLQGITPSIIKCFNENEKFYKIGRTFTTIYERYKYRFIYDYEIMYEYEGSPEDCYNLEIKLKQVNKNNKYKPNIKFNGYTECFSKIDTNNI